MDLCGTRGRPWQPRGVCCSAPLQEGACGEECSPLTASSYSITATFELGMCSLGAPCQGGKSVGAPRALSSLPAVLYAHLWVPSVLAQTFHRAASQSEVLPTQISSLALLFTYVSDPEDFPDKSCFLAPLSFTDATPSPSLVCPAILVLDLSWDSI